jgi:tetratricopeptide (TPR) repeat protein
MAKRLDRPAVAPFMLFRSAALLAAAAACAGRGPGQVSPQDVPTLQVRVAKEPGNAALLSRYAAALFSAQQCDSARTVANKALALNATDDVSVLVIGQCLERAGQYDQAILGYQRFVLEHGKARGAGTVRGRELLARRDQATANARAALRREQELAQQPGDPQTVAVLPVQIVGDSTYQPLSRGLAQMLISDLALLQRFRMVERVQLGAIMDELKFSQSARVDPATAARVGRLVQAGRLVQGLATIPNNGAVRFQATLVQGSGEVSNAADVNGTLRSLLQMEKDLVVQLASSMGYTLAEAERQRILQNGTQNIQAFLAYSRGLLAEDAGDYSRAALYFNEAVQADPNFQVARDQQQAAAAAPARQVAASAGQVTGAPAQEAPAPNAPDPLSSATQDLAATQSEQTAANKPPEAGGSDSPAASPSPAQREGATQNSTGSVKIQFSLP